MSHISFDLGNINEFPHSGISAQQNTLSVLFRKRSEIPPPTVFSGTAHFCLKLSLKFFCELIKGRNQAFKSTFPIQIICQDNHGVNMEKFFFIEESQVVNRKIIILQFLMK